MAKEIVKHSVTCLNQFPAEDGLSDLLSPLTIMTRKANPNVHNEQICEPKKFTTKTLHFGAIALNPTCNIHVKFYFTSLDSDCKLTDTNGSKLPTIEEAILCVTHMAETKKIVLHSKLRSASQMAH
jgi:hypothetical protein